MRVSARFDAILCDIVRWSCVFDSMLTIVSFLVQLFICISCWMFRRFVFFQLDISNWFSVVDFVGGEF